MILILRHAIARIWEEMDEMDGEEEVEAAAEVVGDQVNDVYSLKA
jgi:hypothetical protein